MGCLKKSKKVIKGAARLIGAHLLASTGRIVQTIEDMSSADPDWWTSEMKRDMAEAAVRAEARRLKRDVPNHLIRLAIEHAVALLNDEDETIGPLDLGDVDEVEIDAA